MVLIKQKQFYIKWTPWLNIICLISIYPKCIYWILEKRIKPVRIIFLFRIKKPCINQLQNKITILLNMFKGQMGKKNKAFKKRARNSHMPTVSGPRNCTILEISGPWIWNQKSPKWFSFWGHKLPESGYFWSHKLPKWLSFISGAINCQNGAVSGAINCQNGRQILYDKYTTSILIKLRSVCTCVLEKSQENLYMT